MLNFFKSGGKVPPKPIAPTDPKKNRNSLTGRINSRNLGHIKLIKMSQQARVLGGSGLIFAKKLKEVAEDLQNGKVSSKKELMERLGKTYDDPNKSRSLYRAKNATFLIEKKEEKEYKKEEEKYKNALSNRRDKIDRIKAKILKSNIKRTMAKAEGADTLGYHRENITGIQSAQSGGPKFSSNLQQGSTTALGGGGATVVANQGPRSASIGTREGEANTFKSVTDYGKKSKNPEEKKTNSYHPPLNLN